MPTGPAGANIREHMTPGSVIRVENLGKLRYSGDPGRALSDCGTV